MTESIQRLSPDQSNEQSLQNALNACRGVGGTVVVTPGEWTTGPLNIPSNTTLRINEGAVIRFLDDPSLYPPLPTRWEGVECYGYHPLIVVADAKLVRIEGRGIFDGSGARWWSTYRGIREGRIKAEQVSGTKRLKELNIDRSRASGGGGRETGFLRPSILQIRESSQVVVNGPTFRNSPFWTAHVLYSSGVTIRNCKFENPVDSPNTDGLNIDSSEYVQVSGCEFNVGDDCLCLKSGSDEDGRRVGRPVRNVKVRDCRMNHGHGGIVFGSEISGGIEDIRIEDCEMNRTDRGIRIKARRGRGG
ncbi:MAG: glycoside hydrolase family 28 protein, partial [Spirochaetaceae bacterium]|nr:glycoside hydrolase family 28 protein [Spirochaetaceae bacterium]